MTDTQRRLHIAAIEPGVAGLALALARSGQPVTLIDPDPHDLNRMRETLPRLAGSAAPLITLSGDPGLATDMDCVLAASDAGSLCTDWKKPTSAPVLHLAQCPLCPPLVEQIGPDPSGHIALLGEQLQARHIVLPEGAVPLSARFQAELSHVIERILLTALTPVEIDEILEGAGFAIGPFEAQDLIGVDTFLATRRAVDRHWPRASQPLFERAVSEGRLGRKASVGWYRYPGNGGKVEDPLVEDMAVEEAHFAGHTRRDLKDADVIVQVRTALDALCAQMRTEGHDAALVRDVAARAIGYPA